MKLRQQLAAGPEIGPPFVPGLGRTRDAPRTDATDEQPKTVPCLSRIVPALGTNGHVAIMADRPTPRDVRQSRPGARGAAATMASLILSHHPPSHYDRCIRI